MAVKRQIVNPGKTAVGSPLLSYANGITVLPHEPFALQFPAMGRTFNSMFNDSSIVGAIIVALVTLSRSVEISVDSPNDTAEAEAEELWVESILDDMDVPFDQIKTEIFSMYIHGYSVHELIWKRRLGQGAYIRTPSKYKDGMWGISSISIRPQISLAEMFFEGDAKLASVTQYTPDGDQVPIPGHKLLYFRTMSLDGSPYGRSVLRSAYRDYNIVQRLTELSAIGVERNLVGLPVLHVPSDIINHQEDPARKQAFLSYQTLLSKLRLDTQAGVLLPSDRDPNTKELYYSLELLKSPGVSTNAGVDVTELIDRANLRITMSCLSDWLFLGNQRIGSFALSADKTSIFEAAVGTFVQVVADTLNTQLLPRLYALNGKDYTENSPRFVVGSVSRVALDAMARFIDSMTKAGCNIVGDVEFENALRKLGNLPVVDERGPGVSVYAHQAEVAPKPVGGTGVKGADPNGGSNDGKT